WLIKQGEGGAWSAREVGTIGDPAQVPLPVDISITAAGKGLWVNTFMDGTTHYFDLTDPEHPRQTYQRRIGTQVNMISQSWDGKRVYMTSSLLAHWDKITVTVGWPVWRRPPGPPCPAPAAVRPGPRAPRRWPAPSRSRSSGIGRSGAGPSGRWTGSGRSRRRPDTSVRTWRTPAASSRTHAWAGAR